jgi:ABC-2 type transport system ATP-binding protein
VERVCDRVGILQAGRLVHVQALADLRQTRRIRARFTRPPAAVHLPPSLVHETAVREAAGAELVLDHAGPLPPLLDWLAGQPLADLAIEPLGLGPIYHRYHGAEP